MTAEAREYVTLNFTRVTRKRAKYISTATGKRMNEIMADAVKLLQDRLDLPEPPTRKLE